MMFEARAIDVHVSFAVTVKTLQLLVRHRSPDVGKSAHHAGRSLSERSHAVPIPCVVDMLKQSSEGWIEYVVPAQGVGVVVGS